MSGAAAVPGTKAPDFDLPTTEGGYRGLRDLVEPGGGIVVFVKIECPTSTLLLTRIGPLARALEEEERLFLGITQDDESTATAYRREHGLSFPLAYESAPYRTSLAYGVTTVPTLFVIDGAGQIAERLEGFVKADLLALGSAAEQALALGDAPGVLDGAADLPDIRPG